MVGFAEGALFAKNLRQSHSTSNLASRLGSSQANKLALNRGELFLDEEFAPLQLANHIIIRGGPRHLFAQSRFQASVLCFESLKMGGLHVHKNVLLMISEGRAKHCIRFRPTDDGQRLATADEPR
jgi:hypothetical protein